MAPERKQFGKNFKRFDFIKSC